MMMMVIVMMMMAPIAIATGVYGSGPRSPGALWRPGGLSDILGLRHFVALGHLRFTPLSTHMFLFLHAYDFKNR